MPWKGWNTKEHCYLNLHCNHRQQAQNNGIWERSLLSPKDRLIQCAGKDFKLRKRYSLNCNRLQELGAKPQAQSSALGGVRKKAQLEANSLSLGLAGQLDLLKAILCLGSVDAHFESKKSYIVKNRHSHE